MREMRNMTQRGLALQVEVSERAVVSWELGISYPERESRLLIADVLDVPVAWLFEDNRKSVLFGDPRFEQLESELKRFGRRCLAAQEQRDREVRAAAEEKERLRAERQNKPHPLKGVAPTTAQLALADKRRRDGMTQEERDDEDFHSLLMRGLRSRSLRV